MSPEWAPREIRESSAPVMHGIDHFTRDDKANVYYFRYIFQLNIHKKSLPMREGPLNSMVVSVVIALGTCYSVSRNKV